MKRRLRWRHDPDRLEEPEDACHDAPGEQNSSRDRKVDSAVAERKKFIRIESSDHKVSDNAILSILRPPTESTEKSRHVGGTGMRPTDRPTRGVVSNVCSWPHLRSQHTIL